MNIYLIGLPGSGKSTFGRQLASFLGFMFVDLDTLIEENTQQKIPFIFKEKGEDYFRKVEQKVLLSTCKYDSTVIACGGGTPCFFDNINWINTHGKSIFIDISIEEIISRVEGDTTRPLLVKNKKETLTQLLEKRNPFYTKAHFIINSKELKLADVKNLIFG